MRKTLETALWSLVTISSFACGGAAVKETEGFDAAVMRFTAVGQLEGWSDLHFTADGDSLEGAREYVAPALGASSMPEEPDLSKAKLCEIEIRTMLVVQGVEYQFELQLKELNGLAGGLTEGTYDAASQPMEVKLEGGMYEFESEPISGTIDVQYYQSASARAENGEILDGGGIGGTYQLRFEPGRNQDGTMMDQAIEGTFNVPFSEADVDVDEEC